MAKVGSEWGKWIYRMDNGGVTIDNAGALLGICIDFGTPTAHIFVSRCGVN